MLTGIVEEVGSIKRIQKAGNSANLIEEMVKQKIKNEIEKINFSKDEIKQIFDDAKKQAKSKENLLKITLNNLKGQLKNIEKNIEEIYQDKINKIIQVEDFKNIYEKMQKQKNKILIEIKQKQEQLNQNNEKSQKIDDKEIQKIAKEFLKLESPNKIILEKLIEKIKFDKEKNIKIKWRFENPSEFHT